jgi:hypothetical protein
MSYHVLHVIRLPTLLAKQTSKHALALILISLHGMLLSSVVNAHFHPFLSKGHASLVMLLFSQREQTQRRSENAIVEFQLWFGMLLNLPVNALAITQSLSQPNRLLAVMSATQN